MIRVKVSGLSRVRVGLGIVRVRLGLGLEA